MGRGTPANPVVVGLMLVVLGGLMLAALREVLDFRVVFDGVFGLATTGRAR